MLNSSTKTIVNNLESAKPQEQKTNVIETNLTSLAEQSEQQWSWLSDLTIQNQAKKHCYADLRNAIRTNNLDGIDKALKEGVLIDLELNSLLPDSSNDKQENDVPEDEFRLYTALPLACRFASLETIKHLIKLGAEINGQLYNQDKDDPDYPSVYWKYILPLEAAILSKEISKVKFLLEKKANPNVRYDEWPTSLLEISKNNSTDEITQLLEKWGAKPLEPLQQTDENIILAGACKP